MLIEDKAGNQLLELLKLEEAQLAALAPLTHALVVATRGDLQLVVFNRFRQYWELAGGKIDPGETARRCAARELAEESGVVCAEAELRFFGAMKFLLAPSRSHSEAHVEFGALFTVQVGQVAPFVANDEIAEVRWWDGREPIGEVSVIDRKLLELTR